MTRKKKKSALVLTYHVKNCKREGGFHHFINFLIEDGYDVDWVTITVSSSWLFHHNDKENPKNFFDLWRGIKYYQEESHIRHFSSPVWIPGKVAKLFKMKLANHYWPQWRKLRKRFLNYYDVILVEGSACQYANDIKRDYPYSKILYRPSDILSTFSNVPEPEKMEKKMIDVADKTLCVDETCLNYYKNIAGKNARLEILRNPITTKKDIETLNTYVPNINEKLYVVYVGVSFIDYSIVEYAAKKNRNAQFIMIGPHKGTSHDNIIYTGMLTSKEYNEYLKKACIGIAPASSELVNGDKGIAVGYTRKIINYMKYLMPIVATCSNNYLDIDGFFCVNSKEEFSDKISQCLTYSIDDRIKLRDGYYYAMTVFSEEESKKHFLKILDE